MRYRDACKNKPPATVQSGSYHRMQLTYNNCPFALSISLYSKYSRYVSSLSYLLISETPFWVLVWIFGMHMHPIWYKINFDLNHNGIMSNYCSIKTSFSSDPARFIYCCPSTGNPQFSLHYEQNGYAQILIMKIIFTDFHARYSVSELLISSSSNFLVLFKLTIFQTKWQNGKVIMGSGWSYLNSINWILILVDFKLAAASQTLSSISKDISNEFYWYDF